MLPTPVAAPGSAAQLLPCRAGIGLKPEHFRQILAEKPDLGFFEVHAENYMVAGGPYHHYLQCIRELYPLSIHGVGLSIGGVEPLDEAHLSRLAVLLERYQPAAFSEHLAWSGHGGQFFNDLLPLPYTPATLKHVCEHIDQVQERLRRPMLLENPASYVQFTASTMSEPQFICEVIQRTGCGLLLDVSNVQVSCINHGADAGDYIRGLPLHAVGEIHLAGFAEEQDSTGAPLLIDTHGSPVAEAVWALYAFTIGLTGARPTLIERDNNIPPLPELLAEARQADAIQQRVVTQTGSTATRSRAPA
jgi:uncharacterized protein (UPF0276 family)